MTTMTQKEFSKFTFEEQEYLKGIGVIITNHSFKQDLVDSLPFLVAFSTIVILLGTGLAIFYLISISAAFIYIAILAFVVLPIGVIFMNRDYNRKIAEATKKRGG